MYEVTIRSHFDAAHFLRGYQGKCENVHGHRWQVEITVRAKDTDVNGLAFDFRLLKEKLAPVLEELDHRLLNDQKPFDMINPSSENIASYIYGKLKSSMDENIELAMVKVYESPDSWVAYYE